MRARHGRTLAGQIGGRETSGPPGSKCPGGGLSGQRKLIVTVVGFSARLSMEGTSVWMVERHARELPVVR